MPAKYHRQALLRTLPATILPHWPAPIKQPFGPFGRTTRRRCRFSDGAQKPATRQRDSVIGRREAPDRSVSKQKGRNEWQCQRLRRKASGKAKEIRVLLTNAPIKANDAET